MMYYSLPLMSCFLSVNLMTYHNGYASKNLNLEAYPTLPQTLKMERFVTTVSDFESLANFAKHPTLDFCGSPVYASDNFNHSFCANTSLERLDHYLS